MISEFTVAGITFHTYGLIMGLAIVTAVEISKKYLHTVLRNEQQLWKVVGAVVASGIIGARAWHVLTDWQIYISHPLSTLFIWNGGLSIVGALLGGCVGIFIVTRCIAKHTTFFKISDSVVVGVAVAQAIGRLGNWVNQELYGLPTNLPWKLYIEPHHRVVGYRHFEYFHPLFAYELGAVLAIAGVLSYIEHKKMTQVGDGTLTLVYISLYGLVRFFLEFIRIEKASIPGYSLGFNQVVMLIFSLVAGVALMIRYNKQK